MRRILIRVQCECAQTRKQIIFFVPSARLIAFSAASPLFLRVLNDAYLSRVWLMLTVILHRSEIWLPGCPGLYHHD